MKGRDQTSADKPETSRFENRADVEAVKSLETSIAAGADPFGDMDDDEHEPAQAAADADDAAGDDDAAEALDDAAEALDEATVAAAPTDPAALTQEQAAAALAAVAPAVPPLQQLNFKTRTPQQLATEQNALLGKKAAAFKEYSDGTITADDFSAIDIEVTVAFGQLTAELALQQASAQTAKQTQEQAIAGVKALAATQGHVNYDSDPKAVAQFDGALSALGSDPDMLALSDAEFYEKAHNMVLFMRGITPGAPPPPPAAAPVAAQPRKDMAPPITLRGVPAAATANAGGGMAEQLSRAQGLDFQDLIGRMPKAQRDAYLDS